MVINSSIEKGHYVKLYAIVEHHKPYPSENMPGSYADSEGPDQIARMRSLIRACTVRLQNQWILQNV